MHVTDIILNYKDPSIEPCRKPNDIFPLPESWTLSFIKKFVVKDLADGSFFKEFLG